MNHMGGGLLCYCSVFPITLYFRAFFDSFLNIFITTSSSLRNQSTKLALLVTLQNTKLALLVILG